jgi:hypothetical protein
MVANNGRDPMTGRLLPGNRVAVGNRGSNSVARRAHELRQCLLEAVSPEDVLAVGRKLVELAKDGDVTAAKLWLEYVLGRPVQGVELSGLDAALMAPARIEIVIPDNARGDRLLDPDDTDGEAD